MASAASQYDTPEFNAVEYVAMYPDLQDWWTHHASIEEPQWNGDMRAWALNHWQNFGKSEGRHGRSTVYGASTQETQLPSSGGLQDSPAAKNNTGLWLLLAGLAVGGYFYWKSQQDPE